MSQDLARVQRVIITSIDNEAQDNTAVQKKTTYHTPSPRQSAVAVWLYEKTDAMRSTARVDGVVWHWAVLCG